MPLFRRLTLMLAKAEMSYGRCTGAGSTTTLVDANQTWTADGVKVGDAVVYKPNASGQEITYITNISTGTNTITVSPAIAGGATADGDLYEIIVEGGLAANEQSFAISGTADAGSGTTTIIDAALNANDGFAHSGIKAFHQVYITGGGGVGGSGVITAIDHDTDTLTITSITGVTTGSTFEIRPTPVLLFDVSHNFVIEKYQRMSMRTSYTNLKSILGKRMSVINAKLELAGGTTAANFSGGTPSAGQLPAYHYILMACGFKVAVSGSSITYTPTSRAIPALTIGTYENGVLKKSLGCRGTVVFNAPNVGQPFGMDMTFNGIPKETSSSLITDTLAPEGIIYPGIVPPKAQGATIGAYASIINSISFDVGNNLAMRSSMAAAAGNLSCLITGREMTGSFDPEMVRKADHDFFGSWIAGTLVELYASLGSTAGNVIRVGSPASTATCQYEEFSDSDRDDIKTMDVNFRMVSTTDEGEFTVKIT